MGIEGVGQKPVAKSTKPAEVKKAAPAEPAKPQAPAKKASTRFDVSKNKPMSMTGKFKAAKDTPKVQAGLANDVAQSRKAAQANLPAPKALVMSPGPSGVNTTTAVRPSAAGKISQKEWDNPALLLGKLTQNPASGKTNNSGERCGPSNLLGAALMEGPDSAAKYLNKVADAPENNRLTGPEKKELKEIADKVKNKTATFEDLGRAQDLTYKSGNRVMDVDQSIKDALAPPQSDKLTSAEKSELTDLLNKNKWEGNDTKRVGELVTIASGSPSRVVDDPDKAGTYLMTVEGNRSNTDTSAFTDKEVGDLAGYGGTKASTTQMGDTETVKSIFKDLKPGESAIIRVAGEAGGNNPDHFVTVGRRKDGTAYIYNPDPSKGDATVFVGGKGANQNAAFMKELAKYEDRTGFDPNGNLPKVTRLKVD